MGIFPKSKGRIRREAADWVARIGEGSSEQDRRAFRAWHDADARHAEAYARISRIWDAAGRTVPGRQSLAADEAMPRRPRRAPRLALAASVAALAALMSVILLSSNPLRRTGEPERLLFATTIGEIREIELSDGSRLILDSDSRVEGSFSSAERRLALREGRARFRVAPGDRPFIVAASGSEIIAAGTLFDVNLLRGRTAVLLLEGSVEVRAAGAAGASPRRLAPGEKLVLARGAPPARGRASRGETLWPARMLEFDDTPLAEAVELVNRYSRLRMALADERTGRRRVTGAYRAGDVAGFARSVAAMWELRLHTRTDGSLLLSEADPPDR